MFNQSRPYCKQFVLVLTLLIMFTTFNLIKPVAVHAATPNPETMYSYGVYTSTDPRFPGSKLNYRMYVPANYKATNSYPLVLSLHGYGERGTDNKKHIARTDCITYQLLTDSRINKYPCIIIAPQSRDGFWSESNKLFGNSSYSLEKTKITADLQMAIDLVNATCKKYSVDKNKLYVTGYSYGGFGTWNAIMHYPDMFAAAVPICVEGTQQRLPL